MVTRPPRIFVIAPRRDIAVHTARQLGYPPFGREVVLVSTEVVIRGHQLTPDDHIVWAGVGEFRPSQFASISESLKIAGMTLRAEDLPTVEVMR